MTIHLSNWHKQSQAQAWKGRVMFPSPVSRRIPRQVGARVLFLWLCGGAKWDGHDFLSQVVEAGTAAVVVEEGQRAKWAALSVPKLVVPNCRAALAPLAVRFYMTRRAAYS
jgi:UDP-N-acetylmuramyl pentapeptide synthase